MATLVKRALNGEKIKKRTLDLKNGKIYSSPSLEEKFDLLRIIERRKNN